MILKDLISKNKILSDLFKNIPDKILNHNVNGISGNSKNIKMTISLLQSKVLSLMDQIL